MPRVNLSVVAKKYRVLFLGLVEGLERFEEGMSRLGVNPETARQIVRKAPVILKAGMSLPDARQYAEAIQGAGGKVNIQEDGAFESAAAVHRPALVKPFEYFTMCPECGHKQPKRERCVRCGHAFSAPANGNGGNG